MFESIKEFFDNTSWGVNLLFVFLAIAGILATIVTYIKSKKDKFGAYRIRNFNLISEEISEIKGLDIIMNQKPISNLSTAYIAIWNHGNDLINSSDIAPSDKVRISSEDKVTILGFELDFIKDNVNNINLNFIPKNNEIEINFDYLGKYDGLVLKVFHDGKKEGDLTINGTIKGIGKFRIVEKEDFKFIHGFWNFLFGKLKNKNSNSSKTMLRFFAYATIPIAIPLILIDNVRTLFRHIPNEYLLEKESDS